MKEQDQIRALAELDGKFKKAEACYHAWYENDEGRTRALKNYGCDYLTSYDAIIPLCRKVRPDLILAINLTPSQLSEALLRATGKWKD